MTAATELAELIVVDLTSDSTPGDLIGALAGHAARLGNADPEVLLEWVNKDFFDHELPGRPIPNRDGKFERYRFEDVQRALKTARFRILRKQDKQALAKQERLVARQQKTKADTAAKLRAQLDRERELVPLLYERLAELEAEITAIKG